MEEQPVPKTYMGQFVLIAVVTYNWPSNNPVDFKTAEAFHVWKGTGDMRLSYHGEAVPLEAIRILKAPWGDGSLTT